MYKYVQATLPLEIIGRNKFSQIFIFRNRKNQLFGDLFKLSTPNAGKGLSFILSCSAINMVMMKGSS